jgi:GT2 family glycosyltransferase
MQKIILSIIVPTFHRNNLLRECLDSLCIAFDNAEPDTCEILVTDDGEIDKNARLLVGSNFPRVKWVKGPGRGLSANRNNGAQFASGKWIVFIDDDVVADTDIISNYISAVSLASSIKIFEGRVYSTINYNPVTEIAPIKESDQFYGIGCNFCVEKELYLSVGGCDEGFTHYGDEDYDLFSRLRPYSEVKWLSNCAVFHAPRPRKRGVKFIRESMYNRIRFLKKCGLSNLDIYKNILYNMVIRFYVDIKADLSLNEKATILVQDANGFVYILLFAPVIIHKVSI